MVVCENWRSDVIYLYLHELNHIHFTFKTLHVKIGVTWSAFISKNRKSFSSHSQHLQVKFEGVMRPNFMSTNWMRFPSRSKRCMWKLKGVMWPALSPQTERNSFHVQKRYKWILKEWCDLHLPPQSEWNYIHVQMLQVKTGGVMWFFNSTNRMSFPSHSKRYM